MSRPLCTLRTVQPTVRLEHNLLAVETDHTVHVLVELEAPTAPASGKRPPLRLALVIDRSGSMAGDKLEATKACASYLVRRLAVGDELAVIAYDNRVDLIAPLAAVRTEWLLAVIGLIRPGGSTNLSGGWLKALSVLQRAQAGAGDTTRRILLLTDGQANVGITDPASLVGMATTARGEGVGTTTIGFGADFEEVLLTGMADSGGGNAHFAPTPDAAPGIFAEEFDGLANLVAQNVSVEIRPEGTATLLSVLNLYRATLETDGKELALGDAYAGERRSVVFALHVPGVAELGVAKVADVVLRYIGLGDQITAHEITVPVVVNVVSADEAAQAERDHGVVEEVVVLKAAQARDEARSLADDGDFGAGRAILSASADELRRVAGGSAKPDELLAEADLLDTTSVSLTADTHDAMNSKRMHYDSHRTR